MPAVATVLPVLLDALQAMLPYWVHACNPGHPLHKFMEKSLLKLITTTVRIQNKPASSPTVCDRYKACQGHRNEHVAGSS